MLASGASPLAHITSLCHGNDVVCGAASGSMQDRLCDLLHGRSEALRVYHNIACGYIIGDLVIDQVLDGVL